MGLKHPTIAPYGAFVCADGKAVILSIQNEREWARLCAEVLGDAGLRPTRVSNPTPCASPTVPRSTRSSAAALGRCTRAEAMERLQAAGVAYGALNELDDLIAHPQRRTGRWRRRMATVELMAPGARVVGRSRRRAGPVPGLGEHDEGVRREFGAKSRGAEPAALISAPIRTSWVHNILRGSDRG